MRRSSAKRHLSPSFMMFFSPNAAGAALRKERPGLGSTMELLMNTWSTSPRRIRMVARRTIAAADIGYRPNAGIKPSALPRSIRSRSAALMPNSASVAIATCGGQNG
jgi:hypothetical protein